MAKKRSTTGKEPAINRSQAIRDYIVQHPDMPPKAIRQALIEQGIDVSYGLVGVVKYGGKKPRKAAAAARATRRRNVSLTADDLMRVKKLSDSLGGLEQLRKAIEVLLELR